MFSLWTNRLVFCLSHLAFMEQLNSINAPSLNHMEPFSQQIPSNNFVKQSTGLGQHCSNCPADKATRSHVVKIFLFDLMHKKCLFKSSALFSNPSFSSSSGSLLGRKMTTSCSILLCKHNLCNWWTLMGFLQHSLSCNSHFKSTCALHPSTRH